MKYLNIYGIQKKIGEVTYDMVTVDYGETLDTIKEIIIENNENKVHIIVDDESRRIINNIVEGKPIIPQEFLNLGETDKFVLPFVVMNLMMEEMKDEQAEMDALYMESLEP